MSNDIFKSPCNTIKLLLRTEAIPYLVIEYTRNSLVCLVCRFNHFLLCEASFKNFNISLKLFPVNDGEIVERILQATKITVDKNVITDEMFNDLLESISHAGEILRSRMIEINNKKGTGFTPSDFTTLARLAVKSKQDSDFWSLEE